MKLAALLVLALLCSPVLFAQQQRVENLSQIHIGAGYMPIVRFTPTSLDYSINQMSRFTIGINYLQGYIKVNTLFTQMVPNGNYPNCLMFDNSIAYQYHLPFTNSFTVFVGGQLGLNTIKYEYINFTATSQSIETETTAGVEVGLQYLLHQRFGLTASYKRMRIYATPRNNISLADIGIVYLFKPSQKLKTWLE